MNVLSRCVGELPGVFFEIDRCGGGEGRAEVGAAFFCGDWLVFAFFSRLFKTR